jgi:hypothetical protein
MKKRKTSIKRKYNYEEVYEHPLTWCPLFGSLPEIKNTHLENDDVAYTAADKCLGIIESARLNLGVFDNYMVKDDCLPEVEKLPISIYHGYGEACKAIRLLFQNLDYLALKISQNNNHYNFYNILSKDRGGLPSAPIRESNRYMSGFGIVMENINILEAVPDNLLEEARKITKDYFELQFHHLYALFAILEVWLILTSLLFHNKRSKDITELFLFKKIYKAEKLLETSDYYLKLKQDEPAYQLVLKEAERLEGEKNRTDKSTKVKAKNKESNKKVVGEIYKKLLLTAKYKNLDRHTRDEMITECHRETEITRKGGKWKLSKGTIKTYLEELQSEGKIKLPPKTNRGPQKKKYQNVNTL